MPRNAVYCIELLLTRGDMEGRERQRATVLVVSVISCSELKAFIKNDLSFVPTCLRGWGALPSLCEGRRGFYVLS